MPTIKFVREAKIVKSFRVDQVKGMFDVPEMEKIRQEWSVDFLIDEKPWKIGLIIGPSGSGKSTLAKEAFPSAYYHEGFDWPQEASLLDGFDESLEGKEIIRSLSQVGFSSPPHWLKPFHCLSNGQKMRAELARCLLTKASCLIFDEFTSVVDRDVAKICSLAVQKEIRRGLCPPFVAVSCHYDIADWLQPDWIIDMADCSFTWRSLWRRPEIKLQIHSANTGAWQLFKGNHYLSADINKSARCFVSTWNNIPVAFTSYIHFPHPKVKNAKREHRTVVLPDYQGVGIGNIISEWMAKKIRSEGYRFYSTTSHPSLIWHRKKSPLWRCTRKIGNMPQQTKQSFSKTSSSFRQSSSFEFIG
jgi:ABC-type uncharacterized transport system YnjBCD ATPase subunit